MSAKSLKEKTLLGFAWSGLDKLLQQVIVIVGGIFLARNLLDTDYGLLGVLAIFTAIANIFQEGGFSAALIRKNDVSEKEYNTIFYFNIFISIFLYIILFFCAPLISYFYKNPALTNLARFLFVSCIFNSLSLIQAVQIAKKIDYKQMAKASLISVIFSYALALFFAYKGFGPWALAIQVVSLSFFRCVCLWIFNAWRPTLIFSKRSLKELFTFSSHILASNFLNTFTINIIPSILGKCYTISQAGFYMQANKFYAASELMIESMHPVTYPVLVEASDRIKKVSRKIIRFTAFISFPAFLLIALIANPAICSLIGDRWLPSVPILQILCIGGIFHSLNFTNTHIIKVKGKSSFILKFEIIRNILTLFMILISVSFRLNYLYMISGLSLVCFINYILTSIETHRLIGYKFKEQCKDILPYAGLASVAILSGYLLKFIIDKPLVLMISQILLAGSIYLLTTWSLGSALMKEIVQIIRNGKISF